jgi:large repetitive protein
MMRPLSRVAALALAALSAACGGTSSTFSLTVSKSGSGTGSVSSSPAGIDCGAACSASFDSGASVTLTATPAAGSAFTGWSGACTGNTTCSVKLSADTAVAASFTAQASPGAPTGVTADAGDTQATLHWTAPADTGGLPLTGFVVSSGSGPNAVNLEVGASASAQVVTGLINGTAYSFTVAARNAVAVGAASAPVSVTPRGKPLPVTGLAATAGDGQVSLSWSAGNGNGAAITGYTVTATPGPIVKTTTDTALVFGGLTNGTAYSFTVFATNAVGDGSPSAAVGGLVPGKVPAAPAGLVATGGVRSASLSWSAPDSGGSALTGYDVTQSVGGAAYAPAAATVTGTTAQITGLGDGVSVQFKVSAKNARGSGPASDPSAAVSTVALPGKVAGLTATRGDGSVALAWTAPASASPLTKYTLAWSKAGAAAGSQDLDAAATSATVPGLNNGESYTFTLTAYTAAGAGPASDPVVMVPSGLPGKPTSVAAARADQALSVTWTAPASTGGTQLSGYTLVATPASGPAVSATSTAPASSARISGLTNGTAYTVTVRAQNLAGFGPASDPSSAATPAGLPFQPTITSVTATIRAATVVFVDGAANGDAITGHLVEQSTDGVHFTAASSTFPDSTSAHVGGLANGGAYTFRVSAINGVGTGLPSAASAQITLLDVPSAPRSFTATPDAGGLAQIQLAWQAPSSDGGSGLLGYKLHVTPLGGGAAPGDAALGASATSTLVTGLTQGASYQFDLFASNLVGDGAVASVRSAVASKPDQVTGLTVGARVVGGVNLSWTAPANGGTPITTYRVYAQKAGGAFLLAAASTSTSAQVTGLANGGTYVFHVSAVNDVGEGLPSADSSPLQMFDVAGKPTAVSASSPKAGQLDVTWSAPANAGDPALTNYRLTATPAKGSPVVKDTPDSGTSFSLTGLTSGIAWTVQVSAVNAVGEGASSDPSAPVTPMGPPDAPAIAAASAGIRSVTLSLTAPASDGGSAITGYKFFVSTGGGFSALAPTSIDPPAASFTATFGGLANDTSYTFEAVASNLLGDSATSTPSPTVRTPALPGKVTSLVATAGHQQVGLTWSAAAADAAHPVSKYTIVQVAPTGTTVGTTDGSTLAFAVTGLSYPTQYQFTVQATSDVGDGPASDPSALTGPVNPCGDGLWDPATEECDASAANNPFACDSTCHAKPAVCGDGVIEKGEACDDGASNGPGAGCEFDCTKTLCAQDHTPTTTPNAGEVCSVEPATGTPDGSKLITGIVLASVVGGDNKEHDKVYSNGQVLVDASGRIACAGCNCAPQATANTRIVTCAGGVISPGLINPHDHITYQNGPATNAFAAERYEHRHDWRIGGAGALYNGHDKINNGQSAANAPIWGELRQLLAGTTSVAGSGGGKGLLRNLDAVNNGTASSQLGLDEGVSGMDFDTFPLSDSGGKSATSTSCVGYTPPTMAKVPFDSGYLPHVAEGIDAWAPNELECFDNLFTDAAHKAGGDKIAIIHGVGLTAAQIGRLAARQTSLIWSPRSNLSLYGDTARIQVYERLGVNVALGTDWLQSGSMNLLRELRCAADFTSKHTDLPLDDRALFHMVTSNAADALQVSEKLGRILPGKVADLAIFRSQGGSPYAAVTKAEPTDVLATIRGGTVLFGEATLGNALASNCEALPSAQIVGCSSFGRVVCGFTAETGQTLTTFAAATSTAPYPLAYCGTPASEPLCAPVRDNTWCGTAGKPCQAAVYAGVATSTGQGPDSDGDGVPDSLDNCPTVFNPIRPQDCTDPANPATCKQADSDGDGLGDACDPCPLDASNKCALSVDPSDLDGDGVPNAIDNCPADFNPDQKDADGDGRGDACDPCYGTAYDPTTGQCTTDIYALKAQQPGIPGQPAFNGELVNVQGIATAVSVGSSKGIFLQVDPSAPNYSGVRKSGAFYFVAAGVTGVSEGDLVQVTGATVSLYHGFLELAGGSYSKLSSKTVPAAAPVLASDVRTGGASALDYLHTLVQVTDSPLSLTGYGTAAPSSGDNGAGEYFTDGTGPADGLRVNDFLYATPLLPPVGQPISYLQGILDYEFGDYKLEPRRSTDVDFGLYVAAFTAGGPAFTSVGHVLAPTFPNALTVSLYGARSVDTVINVQSLSADLSLLGPAGAGGETIQVTIPAGQSTAAIQVSGLVKSAAAGVKVWANPDGRDALTASVRVVDYASETPAVASISPSAFSIVTTGTQTLTVTTDIPGVTGGSTFPVSLTNGGNFTTSPTSLTIPAELLTATLPLTATASASGSSVITIGGMTSTATVIIPLECVKGQVVMSTVYGGGGNSGSYYKNDFVELFNPLSTPCKMTNWTLQYASPTGAFSAGNAHTFSGIILAYSYFLVQETPGSNASAAALPSPDYSGGTLAIGSTAGKVLLISSSTAYTAAACPGPSTANYIDLVGWGTATCFETAVGATTANTTGLVRARSGCTDTDNNANDFTATTINNVTVAGTSQSPRNSKSPALANCN